jgi:hypothetical protein
MPSIVSLLAAATEIVAAVGAGVDLLGVCHARTEGWPAGVAARGPDAATTLVSCGRSPRFAGDDRGRVYG